MKLRCVGLICCCLAAGALPADPLIDRDNGPLTGLFGFPDSREGGLLPEAGEDLWQFHVAASSHSTRDASGRESLLLDGETLRVALSYRRRMSGRLELGFELPWVFHESGGLDSFIDGWHSAFGLPDGIRRERPQDQLEFSYADGAGQLRMTRNTRGMGDVRLFGGWMLAQSGHRSAALRFGLKLPTGDSASLLGSGATDASLGIAGDGLQLLGIQKLNGFYRVSATWLGRPDFDTQRTRRVVGQVSAGVDYDVTARTTLALQLMSRSPVYDSAVSPLGDVAVLLTAGLSFRLPRQYVLSFAVGEDVHPGSMPDVTFVLSLQKH